MRRVAAGARWGIVVLPIQSTYQIGSRFTRQVWVFVHARKLTESFLLGSGCLKLAPPPSSAPQALTAVRWASGRGAWIATAILDLQEVRWQQ